MSALWHLFARRITISTGVNDVIAFTDSGGNQTLTLDAGDYYLLGDDSSVDILKHIHDKLEASGAGDAYTYSFLFSVAGRFGSGLNYAISFTSASAAFKFRWGNASTTFDSTLLGWTQSDTSASTSQAADGDPTAAWVASQPPAYAEPVETRYGNAGRTVGGAHYSFDRGGPFLDRDYRFQYVDGDLVWSELASVTGGTFEEFRQSCGGATPFRVYTCTPASGVTYVYPSPDNPGTADTLTLLGTYAFGSAFFNEFRPDRDTQGLEIYSWAFRAEAAT